MTHIDTFRLRWETRAEFDAERFTEGALLVRFVRRVECGPGYAAVEVDLPRCHLVTDTAREVAEAGRRAGGFTDGYRAKFVSTETQPQPEEGPR